jgi:multidrug efflux system membrane fusion protein
MEMPMGAVTKCLLVAALVAPLTGCFEETSQTTAEVQVRPIAWVEVSRSPLVQLRRIPGTVRAAERVDLAFEVGGKVKTVRVKLGDPVKKGDLLAELDESEYQQSSAASEGQLQEANAVLREAENGYRRQAELFQKGWVSEAALDNAKAALDRARSSVKIAEAQLNLTRKDLGDTALRAPYDGVITGRTVEPSQQVGPGQVILQIDGNEGLEVSTMAPETLIGSISKNQIFDVHFPALPGVSVQAMVTEIGTQAEAATAFETTLLLGAPVEGLRAGMSAEVDFVFQGRGRTGFSGDIIRVPPTALLAGDGQDTYAFVYDEKEGVVRRRVVQTENVINNEVLISSGLEPGEIIAIAGLPYLHDGQKVSLLGAGPKLMN